MAKKTTPKKVTLTKAQAAALEKRIRNKKLEDQDITILLGLLSFNQWLQDQLSRAKLSINRLKKLFGFTSESHKKKSNDEAGNVGNDDNSDTNNPKDQDNDTRKISENNNNSDKNGLKTWDPLQNHGRYGANDYTGCQTIQVPFKDAALENKKCPNCLEDKTEAKIYSMAPRFVVFLDSAPQIFGKRYELQRGRCSVCEKYFTAPLPAHLNEQSKYSYRCSTSIAIHHYYGGMPFKRMEMIQAAQGVPLSDSTQYDLMKELYQTAVEPVAQALRTCAANGNSQYLDDTPGRITDQITYNRKNPKDKSGVHATALISEYENKRIYLFDTNTQTAGKQLKELLSKRTSKKKFITMSDASASNFPEMDDDLMARWVISLCLSHGRRRFVELLDGQDEDIVFILELIGKVYTNERHCIKNGFSDKKRLSYHQQHSAPVMAAMFTWFNNLLLFKSVEPNSRFGEAILYILKRWEELTQFLKVPGAKLGRVENWRGNQITRHAQLIPFPVPARQTGRALLTHPAFVQSHTFALGTSAITRAIL